jgi:hypothetical protein
MIFQQALKESKEQTGIDFYKLILGDERENKKYDMKMRQAKMRENNN